MRPEVRRRYYESVFDDKAGERFRGATFDEYYELLRARSPGMSRWSAAIRGASNWRGDFLALAGGFEEDPEPETDTEGAVLARSHPHLRVVAAKGEIDLRKRIKRPDVAVLEMQRQTITGWDALGKARWLHVELRMCKAGEVFPLAAPPAPCERARIADCDDGCVVSLGRSLRCRALFVLHARTIDLRAFAAHDALTELVLSAPILLGARHLTTRSLRKVQLAAVDYGPEVRALLEANAAALEEVKIRCDAAFAPADLPSLPRLRILTVPAFPPLRRAWLDFAMKRTDLALEFSHPGHVPGETRYQLVEAAGRGNVVRVHRQKKEEYELRDLADAPGEVAIASTLPAEAKKAKHKLRCTTEGGVIVAASAELEACRWAASFLAEKAAGRPAAPAAEPARAAPKARKKAARAPEKWLADWEEQIDDAIVAAACRILDRTEAALAALGPRASRDRQREVLKRCIVAFNRLDAAHGGFIGTLEAEEILDAFAALAARTKLAGDKSLADEWRDF